MTKTKYVPVWKKKYYDKCAELNNDDLLASVLLDSSFSGDEMSSERDYQKALISEAVLRERLLGSGFLNATP